MNIQDKDHSEKLYDDEYYNSWKFVIDAFTPNEQMDRKYKTYLFAGSNGLTKIGRAIDVIKRLKTLRSANPDIKLIAYCEDDIERILHNEYADKRVHSEWFALSSTEINSIIRKYKFKKVRNNPSGTSARWIFFVTTSKTPTQIINIVVVTISLCKSTTNKPPSKCHQTAIKTENRLCLYDFT